MRGIAHPPITAVSTKRRKNQRYRVFIIIASRNGAGKICHHYEGMRPENRDAVHDRQLGTQSYRKMPELSTQKKDGWTDILVERRSAMNPFAFSPHPWYCTSP
jgi:hypothetical protein